GSLATSSPRAIPSPSPTASPRSSPTTRRGRAWASRPRGGPPSTAGPAWRSGCAGSTRRSDRRPFPTSIARAVAHDPEGPGPRIVTTGPGPHGFEGIEGEVNVSAEREAWRGGPLGPHSRRPLHEGPRHFLPTAPAVPQRAGGRGRDLPRGPRGPPLHGLSRQQRPPGGLRQPRGGRRGEGAARRARLLPAPLHEPAGHRARANAGPDRPRRPRQV